MTPPRVAEVRLVQIHFFKQRADKRPRPGNLRLPAAVRPVRLIKIEEGEAPQSAGAEFAAPMAALRLGQSLHRKGLPALHAGRRALRRFTAVIFVEPGSTHLGPRLPIRATGFFARIVQQSSLHTGRIADRAGSEAPRGVRLIRPDPQAPLPAPPTAITG